MVLTSEHAARFNSWDESCTTYLSNLSLVSCGHMAMGASVAIRPVFIDAQIDVQLVIFRIVLYAGQDADWFMLG